jgi:phosphoserine aminotransferase
MVYSHAMHKPVKDDGRVFNFSGGPGALPESVVRQAQQALERLPGCDLSILGISHRSSEYQQINDVAQSYIRRLLQLPDRYKILFLQGGGSLQFSMIPMNFLRGREQQAEYIVSGYWSAKSVAQAYHEGDVRIVWDGRPEKCCRLPDAAALRPSSDAAYFHYVANETVEGLQFPYIPETTAPLICDMSSNFLSAPVDVERYSLIYAHAQKNLGPAGVTVVILDEAMLETIPTGLHGMLDYRSHVAGNSIYNTPPVFSIYFTMLVARWLEEEIGGLAAMAAINQQKSAMLYKALGQHAGFYQSHALADSRSQMNVTFRLPDEALTRAFITEAEAEGMYGLGGHRSIGGIRASLYNAVTVEAVEKLCDFMADFAHRH